MLPFLAPRLILWKHLPGRQKRKRDDGEKLNARKRRGPGRMLGGDSVLPTAIIVMNINDKEIGHGQGHRNDKYYQPLAPRTTIDDPGAVLERHLNVVGILRLALTLVMMQTNVTGRGNVIGAGGPLITEGISPPVGDVEDAEGTSYVCFFVIVVNVRLSVNMMLILERVF